METNTKAYVATDVSNLKDVISNYFIDHSLTETVDLHNDLINSFIEDYASTDKGVADPIYVKDTVHMASQQLKLMTELFAIMSNSKTVSL